MPENNQSRNPFLFAPALLLPILLFFGVASFVFSEPFAPTFGWLVAVLLFLFAFGFPIMLFCCLRGGKWLSASLMPVDWRGIVLSIGMAVMMMVQSVVCRSLMIDGVFEHKLYTVYGLSFEIVTDSAGGPIGVFFAFALIPAILEGFLFRGIFMHEYRFGGVVLSILFSSVLCGMTGVTFSAFVLYFLNAVMLAVTTFITGNFLCSVFAHLLSLVFSLFWEKYFLFLALEIETRAVLFFLLLGVWLTAAVFVFDAAEKILRKRGEKENEMPRRLSRKTRFVVFLDMISAPMLWADCLIFAVCAVLHFFL